MYINIIKNIHLYTQKTQVQKAKCTVQSISSIKAEFRVPRMAQSLPKTVCEDPRPISQSAEILALAGQSTKICAAAVRRSAPATPECEDLCSAS